MWLSLHPIIYYSLNFQFLPFFVIEMSTICDFHSTPLTNIHLIYNFCRFFFMEMLKLCDFHSTTLTNIHWIFNFCRFVHWTICDFHSTPSTNAHWIFADFFVTVCVRYAAGKKVVKEEKILLSRAVSGHNSQLTKNSTILYTRATFNILHNMLF